jgi:hypothetical protein
MNLSRTEMNLSRTEMNLSRAEMNLSRAEMNLSRTEMNLSRTEMNLSRAEMNLSGPGGDCFAAVSGSRLKQSETAETAAPVRSRRPLCRALQDAYVPPPPAGGWLLKR